MWCRLQVSQCGSVPLYDVLDDDEGGVDDDVNAPARARDAHDDAADAVADDNDVDNDKEDAGS